MSSSSPDVFLSYTHKDMGVARRFATALQEEGYSVWWDQEISTGEAYDEITEGALQGAKAVVVLWSEASVKSRWVRAEATSADRRGTLAPVMIEDCQRPIMFELRLSAELAHWEGDRNDPAWRTFVSGVGRLVGRAPAQSALPAMAEGGEEAAKEGAKQAARRAPLLRGASFVAVSCAVVAALALAAGLWIWQRSVDEREARAQVPEISRLLDAGDVQGAYSLAGKIARLIPDDPVLKSLAPLFSATYEVSTEPEGAEVAVRDYSGANGDWKVLGHSPLARFTLPRQALRWRISKEGHETTERANALLGGQDPGADWSKESVNRLDVALKPTGEQPADMVFVPGGPSPGLAGVAPMQTPPFYIDRFEVTNEQYKEFVDAGGYERRTFWEGLDLPEDAMRRFVDSTGRPGPANWELGSYHSGESRRPVTGVSWYEAQAYARFRGKALPTIYHWLRAAVPETEMGNSLAASMGPLSNMGSQGLAEVGHYQGMGAYGTYDQFGNAREWLANRGSGGGWVVGGSWQDPPYAFISAAPQDRMERLGINGLRLVRDIEVADNGVQLGAAVQIGATGRDPATIKPVPDEVFAVYRAQFAYESGPLNASPVEILETTPDWTKQRVTIDAGYDGERMDLILFVPTQARPPLQAVIVFSTSQVFVPGTPSKSIEPGIAAMPIDYLVKSGRMLVEPVYQGTYERQRNHPRPTDEVTALRRLTEWRKDLGRTIDYLQTRQDVDSSAMAYMGLSYGATTPVSLVALEPRIKVAVLMSGGLGSNLSPMLDTANYAPRIRIPVLMVNGRYDELFPVETSQKPLFNLLGTPAAEKRHVILESGHGSPPRAEALRETLGWLDKYLGPVNRT